MPILTKMEANELDFLTDHDDDEYEYKPIFHLEFKGVITEGEEAPEIVKYQLNPLTEEQMLECCVTRELVGKYHYIINPLFGRWFNIYECNTCKRLEFELYRMS
jgi:hypothetical protein